MTKVEKQQLQAIKDKLVMADGVWERATCGEYIKQAVEDLNVLIGEPAPADDKAAG